MRAGRTADVGSVLHTVTRWLTCRCHPARRGGCRDVSRVVAFLGFQRSASRTMHLAPCEQVSDRSLVVHATALVTTDQTRSQLVMGGSCTDTGGYLTPGGVFPEVVPLSLPVRPLLDEVRSRPVAFRTWFNAD